MTVSQKAQYALRAVFELAKRQGQGWVKVSDIAETQAIPIRFLEIILNQLKQGGIVMSRRGVEGGHVLAVAPRELTVGRILSFVDGPVGPVACVSGQSKDRSCPLYGNCAFLWLWERAREAVSRVYDGTTIQDLIDQEQLRAKEPVISYCI